jgi:hypothetical protein
MKRFKDASKLSDVNAGGKVSKKTLFPRSVYSQIPGPGRRRTTLPSPASPPPSPAPLAPIAPISFSGKNIPDDFVERTKDALRIIKGQMQIDEKLSLSGSGILAVSSFALSNFPRLTIFGHGMSQLGQLVALSQLLSAAINLVKPKFRGFITKFAGVEELKEIQSKKYQIQRFQLVKDPSSGLLQPGGTPQSMDMNLKQISDSMVRGSLYEDHWTAGNYAYSFSKSDDLDKIATMFERNDWSNKFDSWISGLLPFTTGGAVVGYVYSQIQSANKKADAAGASVKADTPGVFTPITPEQKAANEEARQNRRNKYN